MTKILQKACNDIGVSSVTKSLKGGVDKGEYSKGIYLLSLFTGHTAHWCTMLLTLPFPMSLCFLVFFSVPLSLDFFNAFSLWPKYVHLCTHSLNPLLCTPGEFQAWDSLWYTLTRGPRGGVGVCIEQKVRSIYLPWPGLQHWTSHLAVQHATVRPPRTLKGIRYLNNF